VKFDSQRISHPDRIFFDLRDTKLASTLVGKTFDVDDGFLKKIRAAEFQPGRTRIVLEVDELASYDAFLLPNPYRLIIDIHGKQGRSTMMAKGHSEAPASAEAADAGSDDASLGETTAVGQTPRDDAESAKKANEETAKVARITTKITPQEFDLPPIVGTRAQATRDKAVKSSAVVKTTVAVPGSGRRIPKTIVSVDDEVPTTVAALEPDRLRPDVTPAQRGAIVEEKDDASAKAGSRHRKGRKSGSTANAAADTADLQVREARPTAAGDRSLIRALGLKIGKIVIDAGHGGHDVGTIGPNGLLEKDLVLDVAKRLGRLLESRLGAEVIYTRQDDTFIPLETRTAIANRERADLFISIHANSSRDEDARGVETYYLNFTSSPEALEVAARENAVSEKSIYELQDLVKKIALKEKIEESREFASDVQQSLYGGLSLRNSGVRNRGIKKAPFIVLIGANMPSILAEISFVSNPTDERKLETAEHRQRIAESLYRGVSKYVNGLSGVKVASKGSKSDGQ
jgi:N-acetylmuramoyl-L-alanine amidase